MELPKKIDSLEKILLKHFKKSKQSTLSIGIQVEDQIKIFSTPGIKVNQKYGLGSISKTLIGSFYSMLIEENKINLNDRIDTFVEMPPYEHCPTIQDLLTHCSGYSYFLPRIPTIRVLLLNGFNKKNIYTNIKRSWVLNYLITHRPKKIRHFMYSDFNYAVLSIIIENIFQKPYQEIISEFMKNEIQLEDSGYYNDFLSSSCPHSWRWENDNPFIGAGGAYSTIPDMLKYLNYQINHKQNRHAHGKYVRNSKSNVFSGFSWNSFYNGSFYWHIGGQGYFRSYALFDKKRQISIVILSTVNKDIQHVNNLGSHLYRYSKRNSNRLFEFLSGFGKLEPITQFE